MNCPNCGAPVMNPDFCGSCGAQLREPKNTNYGDSYNSQTQPRHTQRQQQPPVYTQPTNAGFGTYAQTPMRGYHPDEHVSTWGWIGRWLLMCIPILNIVLLLVWGFGGSSKRSLVTWARAQLVLTLISVIIAVIAAIIMAVNGVNIFESIQHAFQG